MQPLKKDACNVCDADIWGENIYLKQRVDISVLIVSIIISLCVLCKVRRGLSIL